MEPPFLRLLIQEKIADGRLPSAPIPCVFAGPGTGQACDGCSEPVTQVQTVVENLDAGSRAARFHVACFHVLGRRAATSQPRAERSPSGSIRVQRPPCPAGMVAQRAAGAAAQLRVRMTLQCGAAA